MKTPLNKRIKILKYSYFFSQNSLFFVCLFNNYINYSFLRKELVSNNFVVKFSKNKLVKNLVCFTNIKKFLTSRIFLVSKKNFKCNDFLIVNDLLLKDGYLILFYLDNKFYFYNKLKFLDNSLVGTVNILSSLSSFYLILKLGFFLKFYRLNH